jgi:nucleotide sugar dehydrogenase
MKIGVLGIGKLGLCFALNLERCGYEVLGIDISKEYVRQINAKTFFSYEPGVNELLSASKGFSASTQIEDVIKEEFEILFVMVATPSLSDGSYDDAQIERVIEDLFAFGKRATNKHLVIGCTVMPGYTDKLQERVAALNYTVSYNPEFISQGNILQDRIFCDQVLIGELNKEAGDLIQSIYLRMCKSKPTICRMKPISAEICKIATNCFLTTKISFANSIGDLATIVGADPDQILKRSRF